ncbi:dihydrolipoyl dehydrogenase [Roseovarius sp. B08]|uniref:dihydrolipoyl dehydrogenase n=1 Tax=Roseovarius sp. B08 TaxID=3449223 RepID=UPI003EDCADAF
MATYNTDVVVIGAGTAGLAAERHAREEGATTLLIDPDFAGTTCATTGCMPSKLLIAAADAAHGARQAEDFGITTEPKIDGRVALRRVRRLRDGFARSVRESMADLPEGTCLRGRARFEAPGLLKVDTGHRIEARAVVIATGAFPAVPDSYEVVKDCVLTNETVFELGELPESLGVIGAGPLGLELAQAMSRLGVRVEMFDAGDRLAGLPKEISDTLLRILTEAFPIHLKCKPEPSPASDGVRLTWDDGEKEFSKLLVAAGRPPALSGLNLCKAGLELDRHGTPYFDAGTMQCGDAPIFIAGDANHDRPLLHEASDEGAVAGYNAAAWPDLRGTVRKVPLRIAFTRPEAAVVGTIPDAEGHVCGEVDFTDQGRAKVEGRARGLVRLHARAEDGRLVGAALCAPGGEHLAHMLAWAIQCEMTASDMLNLPFYHPVLEEGLQTALRSICRQANLTRPWQRDDAQRPGSDGGAPIV